MRRRTARRVRSDRRADLGCENAAAVTRPWSDGGRGSGLGEEITALDRRGVAGRTGRRSPGERRHGQRRSRHCLALSGQAKGGTDVTEDIGGRMALADRTCRIAIKRDRGGYRRRAGRGQAGRKMDMAEGDNKLKCQRKQRQHATSPPYRPKPAHFSPDPCYIITVDVTGEVKPHFHFANQNRELPARVVNCTPQMPSNLYLWRATRPR